MNDDCPCDDCNRSCDGWEMHFCCTYCEWFYGDDEPPCDECDPMDI